MDKAIEDLHYRFEQISEWIKNQQNKTALLVLEELKDVITQDYLTCIIHEPKNKIKKNRNWHPDFSFVLIRE